MKRLVLPIALTILSAALLSAVPFATVLAQSETGGVPSRSTNTRAARAAEKAKAKASEPVENPFPNATRKDPSAKIAPKLAKKIDKALKALYDEKYDLAETTFNEILADEKAGNYEKALAYQALGNIYNDRDDDTAKTLEYTRKAIDLDALPNVTHFGVMLQYASMSMVEEKYEDAIVMVDRWLKETGSEKDTAYSIKAQSLYRMERLDEAAATIKKAITISSKPTEAWYQLLLASYYEQDKFAEAIAEGEAILKLMPDSKTLTRMLGNVYIQAEQPDKAVALLSAGYAKGMMTTESEIKQLYQLYNVADRPLEAIKVIEAGLAAGTLPRSLDHLRSLGDSFRLAEKSLEASAAFAQAAEVATDGEMNFLQAYTLYEVDKFPEAKVAVQKALQRTPFKSEGQAWLLLGNCELETSNKAAAIAAFQKATGYESTRKSAETWLKNAARM